MKFGKLHTEQEMPQVGLGLWQVNDPDEFEKAVDTALELGYRHFDTAYTYKNEVQLGKVLHKWINTGKIKREELFITTKLPQIGMDRARIEHFLKLSLTSLQMTYVDLYLLHFPIGFKYLNDNELAPIGEDGNVLIDNSTDLKAIWEGMEEQVVSGRTKSIGLSNFNINQIQRIVNHSKILPVCVQVEMNVYLQQPILLQFCNNLNIAVVGYGNFGSPGRITHFPKIGRSSSDFKCPQVLTDPDVLTIGTKYKKAPAQILLRYLIQYGVLCIPSAVSAEFLKQNIEVFDFELEELDMEKLKLLDQGEVGRSFKLAFYKGCENHAEYPFQDTTSQL